MLVGSGKEAKQAQSVRHVAGGVTEDAGGAIGTIKGKV
jgi:hypothetical protein